MDGQQANQCTYRVEWIMKSYEQHTNEWWMKYNDDVDWRWMDDEWWIWIYEYECYI